jgi:hypothetical protein
MDDTSEDGTRPFQYSKADMVTDNPISQNNSQAQENVGEHVFTQPS